MSRSFQPQTPISETQRGLDAVAKALFAFIVVLSIIWAAAATSLLQQAWTTAKKVAVVMPTPIKFTEIKHLWDVKAVSNAPVLTEEERLEDMTPSDALNDPLGRVSPEFRVPGGLKRRTLFWFNIYTKYGQYDHVIHHTRYPWIIYKVIRGQSIIDKSKGPLWLRRQKLEKMVRAERNKIRTALRALSKKKSYRGLTGLQKRLYNQLKNIGGKKKYIFLSAAQKLRSQLGQKDFFEAGLIRGSKYLPTMEQHFAEAGLPTELTRIPFVESSFNEKAESKVGASGVWQIMPKTGRAYMKVGKYIDERNSPLKATKVAAALLKQNHRALKSWPLAVTAYNNGLGNIRQAMRAAGSRDIGAVITKYHQRSFKFASANFYTSFLAALHAEKYQDILFDPYQKTPLRDLEEIRLSKRIRAKSLIKELGMTRKEFLSFNLDVKNAVKKNKFLPKGLRVLLPPSRATKVKKQFSKAKPKNRTKA
ncbi:MAG: lytic transglycosylase domain-containing protein [Bdellovibrionales bacterium]|nr:lytic transglycosylase domain-containing protein [Bdellovibrionales bacterium]